MKNKITKFLIPIFAGIATSAFAAQNSSEHSGSGLLIWFFIAFGVMLLLSQAAPALIMFFSMLKGLFSMSPSEASFSPWKTKNRK